MSYQKRIILVFIFAILFALVMFILRQSSGLKENQEEAETPIHEHAPGVIEEHEH